MDFETTNLFIVFLFVFLFLTLLWMDNLLNMWMISSIIFSLVGHVTVHNRYWV